MKFELITTRYWYKESDASPLMELGMPFIEEKKWSCDYRKDESIDTFIEINTLEELIEIIKKTKSPIILSENTLEIYDGLRE